MSFLRKFFGASEADPGRGATPDAPVPPSDHAEAAPEAPEVEPVEAPEDAGGAWWADSSAASAELPARSQSAEMYHPEVAPEPAEGAEVRSKVPTAPLGELAAQLAREEAHTPPEGTPVLASEEMEGTRQLPSDSAPAVSSHRSAQGLAATALRDIGRVREINQDSVFALLTTLPRGGSDVTIGLFIVADGMGGHQGGEVASRLAVRTVVYHVLSQLVMPALDETMTEALQPLMISAVQAANEAIWDAAQLLGTDMGTTCTAALLVGHGLYIAHVGDSRAYLFEPGGLRVLTADHSTVGRLIQLGQLDPSEAREHPLRNQLYRTIGQQPQVMVDFVYQPMGQSSHLLLCSDGLWGLVEESLMEQALTRSPWPQDACEELIALANLAGGEDNISAVVVSLPVTER